MLRMIDLSNRFGVAAAMTDQTAQTAAQPLLVQWILLVGPPGRNHYSTGTKFEAMEETILSPLLRIDNVAQKCVALLDQWTIRTTQKTNKRALGRVLNGEHLEEWDVVPNALMFSSNRSVHKTKGYSSQFLMIGEEAPMQREVIFVIPPL